MILYIIIVILVFFILYLSEKYEKFSLNNILDDFIEAIPIYGFDKEKTIVKKNVKEDLKKTVQQLQGFNIYDEPTLTGLIGSFPEIDTGITRDSDEKYCNIKFNNVFNANKNNEIKNENQDGKIILF
jgi:hypothetical protein